MSGSALHLFEDAKKDGGVFSTAFVFAVDGTPETRTLA